MNFFRSIFLRVRFFVVLAIIVATYITGFFNPGLEVAGHVLLLVFLVTTIADLLLLFSRSNAIEAKRTTPKRFSNGDANKVHIECTSDYPFQVSVSLIDEIPDQFQIRDFLITHTFKKQGKESFSYELTPTSRGEYHFGNINILVHSRIGFVSRKVVIHQPDMVPVYPSFIQMRKFEMYAMSNRLTDIGVKKIRRLGHTMEFDQIKEYVRGDDIRSINWKATARSQQLMVNQYQDERSQQIINVIDIGRVMKLPFDGLTLLEYAINTSLVISNIALLKEDKAGVFTFSNKDSLIIKPEKKRTHIRRIQEGLYNIDTNFMESDYERLMLNLRTHLNQRSLVLLYTNFETISSMERQLPYLQRIARDHLLVAIFFENTELTSLIQNDAENVDDVYVKTVAEKFGFEKKQIVKTLNRYGIQTILTPPKELSINAINKYLEMKSRGMI